MAPVTVEVRSRVVGGSPDEPVLAPVQLDLPEETITVAELIRRTVEEQVRELRVRQYLDLEQARRALDRQYLTAEEIVAQAERGAIRPRPPRRALHPRQVDPAAEVERALRAFEAGAYLILVDGQRVERLDEEVRFAPGTTVTFLRLMPLVGGAP